MLRRREPELTSALAAAAADEDVPGGSARSRRARRPEASPHAPEQLRMLLAAGRDAKNDKRAQSEKGMTQKKYSRN